MDPRFITKNMHAYLDYPLALFLLVAPFWLGLGGSHPLAKWLSVGAGVAAFILPLFTDHKLGVFRVVPFSLHLEIDALLGVVFLLAPTVFRFNGIDAIYYAACGAAVVVVVSLNKPEPTEAKAVIPSVA